MKVFRFQTNRTGRDASTRPCVVIISPGVSDSKAQSLINRFPKALRIAEVFPGTPARDGYFNVLRIKKEELDTFDYDLKGCRAILVEGVVGLFYMDAVQFCSEVAERANLDTARVRLCCSMLSGQGACNLSCYAAAALRDYAAEQDITGLYPTSKSECLGENSLCLCVKP